MRVLINYAEYADRVTIHCLAEDARIVVAPFKRVSSLETLYRASSRMGVEILNSAERKMKKWGHGGCSADVKPEHFDLLGIKKPLIKTLVSLRDETKPCSSRPPSVSMLYRRHFGGASLLAKRISLFTERLPVFDF